MRQVRSATPTNTLPNIERNTTFSEITSTDVEFFKEQLGSKSAVIECLTSENADNADDIAPFNVDWMHKYQGRARVVLKPQDKEEMSKILQYCNMKKLAVVPQGGNTGLVGGSVPVFVEIVIISSRMNNIRSFDEVSVILVVDAGVLLQTADEYLKQRGHVFPLDLGAKGSCHIGGNVATNAGGLRLLRYGNLHGNAVGIEAVLPNGTVIDSLSTLRKNNTGYDIKQLFIGSEGTIGFITGISILCPSRPKSVHLAYLGLESFSQVQRAYRDAKGHLAEILSAFEMMDGTSQKLVHEHTGLQMPLENDCPFYCLLETSGSHEEHYTAKLDEFLQHLINEGIIADGVLAQDETQMQTIWRFREGVAEVLNHLGGTYKYDVSIPLPQWYQLVEDCRERLLELGLMGDNNSSPVRLVTGYGHIGDSNIHLNVSVREYNKEIEKALEPWVYEWIQKHKGSISAEHGVGLAKKDYIKYSQNNTMVQLMKEIKGLYDPVRQLSFSLS